MANDFDFRNPDYVSVFRARAERLQRIRANPSCIPALKAYYRDHIPQFITDWGCTYDPRNLEIGLPSVVPFVLFPRQTDWIDWVLDSWRSRRPGVSPKSRESGMSWLAVSLSCALCLFYDGMNIGFGSRKEEYVDKLDAPKSLFWKGRKFMELLPPEFRGGFNLGTDAPYMRLIYRETSSIMTGEAGANIGRGDRTSLYFVDEAAFLEHPQTVDAALSQTTNCRIDVSTANGLNNPFHTKVTTWPSERVFRFHWRDDPRKDDAWYAKQVSELSAITIAQELDIDFEASQEGTIFFTEDKLLQDSQPVEYPSRCDAVYAIVDTAMKDGKKHDGVGVAYFAYSRLPQQRAIILDWDTDQVTGAALENWIPRVFARLEELAQATGARMGSLGAWIEDKQSGTILLQKAPDKGWPATAIDGKLTALGKEGRALSISDYVHRGMVRISDHAFHKTSNFKGNTRNHLLWQVLGFRVGVGTPDDQDDLFDCFCYGVSIALGNSAGF